MVCNHRGTNPLVWASPQRRSVWMARTSRSSWRSTWRPTRNPAVWCRGSSGSGCTWWWAPRRPKRRHSESICRTSCMHHPRRLLSTDPAQIGVCCSRCRCHPPPTNPPGSQWGPSRWGTLPEPNIEQWICYWWGPSNRCQTKPTTHLTDY